MPFKKTYGDAILPGSLGSKQVRSIPTTKGAEAPISVDQFCRNTRSPDARFQSALHNATNAGVIFRSKEVFAASANFWTAESSGGAGDRARWRFAFHTGPYSHALYVNVGIRPQDVLYSNSTYVRLDISTNTDGSSPAFSQTFVHGMSPLGTTEARGWQYLKEVEKLIDGLAADTDYYGTFYDVDGARIQWATVGCLESMTENLSGYLASNISTQSDVLDVYREKVATIQRAVWRRGAGRVLNWNIYTSTTTGRSSASTTMTNVVDNSSTTVSAATPGYTLDMTGKNRLTQTTGVPVVMKAWGSTTGANGGRVTLRDSAGATVLQIAGNPWVAGAAARWHSVTGVIPASAAKYDLHYDCGQAGSTFTLRDVTIYEHET